MTTRAALHDETVSSGNGIGATALATLLHERCQEDWQRRFDNGAQAITMHDVSAHDETARWLAARGVTVAPDLLAAAQAVVKAWDAGSLVVTDFDHDTYAIEDIRRLRAAIEEADRG